LLIGKVKQLKSLTLKGCSALQELDCAENQLKELDISDLKELRQVSVKENLLNSINASNCINLSYIDYSSNGKYEPFPVIQTNFTNCLKLKKLFATLKVGQQILKLPSLKLLMIDNKDIDIKKESEKQQQRQKERQKNNPSGRTNNAFFSFLNRNKVNPEPQPSDNQTNQQNNQQTFN